MRTKTSPEKRRGQHGLSREQRGQGAQKEEEVLRGGRAGTKNSALSCVLLFPLFFSHKESQGDILPGWLPGKAGR